MKGEERIIELLSEYLVKADKHEGEIKQKQIEQNQKQIEQNQKHIQQNQKHIDQNQQEMKEIRLDFQKESRELRSQSLKNDIRQEALLKEILSLSKRVLDLEE